MIEVKNVFKLFDQTPVVTDVSFEVARGETLVLLGTSGSGKTTTLKMLNRLLEPDAGEIKIDGKNSQSIPLEQLRRQMGYVIQQVGLFPHYTVAENVAIVPQLLGWSKDRISDRIQRLLSMVGLPVEQFGSVYPHQLSGGQQQRIGLARALAADPPIILMDEPFGALDPITRHRIRQEFLQWDELKTKTTLLVTHDVLEATMLGDRICLMDKGRIVQIGTPAELIYHPANAFVHSFFDFQRIQLESMITAPVGKMSE
jgi:osmoprotectant transport system ATP-binding protein